MNLSFRYKKVTDYIQRPIIPLQSNLKDGTLFTIVGMLGSGCNVVLMPKDTAELLKLNVGRNA